MSSNAQMALEQPWALFSSAQATSEEACAVFSSAQMAPGQGWAVFSSAQVAPERPCAAFSRVFACFLEQALGELSPKTLKSPKPGAQTFV